MHKQLFVFVLTAFVIPNVESSDKSEKSEEECAKNLNNVPVQKNFDLEKFTGTWYTTTRTTSVWGKNTWKSSSIEIVKQDDGTYRYSYTGQSGDKCLPVETGILQQRKKGQYLMKGSNPNQATMIITQTDYQSIALVYYCFKYKPGQLKVQCQKDGAQVEIISKAMKPLKKDVNLYLKKAANLLCSKAKDFEATETGICKIPDLLAEAKRRADENKAGDLHKCGGINRIPVQQDFNVSQMEGFWYEIARTRFTFNKMESIVTFNKYDAKEQKIKSLYTGTLSSPGTDDRSASCVTAIQATSKPKQDAQSAGDRLGRIGGKDSTYDWAPIKVLYADNDHMMFYACYAKSSAEEPCVKQAMEVTLSGRTRSIAQAKRDSIYRILSSICIDPKDMVETKFHVDCSNWVAVQTEEIEPDDCPLSKMPLYAEYDNDQIQGLWYLYAYISNNTNIALRGVVMEKSLKSTTELVDMSIMAFDTSDNKICTQYEAKSRDRCLDVGDHITTMPRGGDGHFVFSKILHVDEHLLIEYTCTKRNEEDTCTEDGILFNVYTRNGTISDEVSENDVSKIINNIAKTVCLNPSDLQYETEWCNSTDLSAGEIISTTIQCDVDQLSIFSDMAEYVQSKIYGYWYEIARSFDDTNVTSIKARTALFTSENNETLNIYYSSRQNDGTACTDVSQTFLLPRCRTESNGDYLARFAETENYTSFVPFKIIFTDYTNVLVTYTCEYVLPDGRCSETDAHIKVWSRTSSLSDADRDYAYEMVYWTCLNPHKDGFMVLTEINETTICKSKLESFWTENEHGTSKSKMEDNVKSDDNVADVKQQRDQRQDKSTEIHDIDAAFLISDDEFFNGPASQRSTVPSSSD